MGYSMRPSQTNKTKKEVKIEKQSAQAEVGVRGWGEDGYYRAGLVLSILGEKGVSVSHSKWQNIPAE